MRGRNRGYQERVVILAHQTEVMARQEKLRAVHHYLPKSTPAKPPKSGAAAMLDMVRRIKAEQDKRATVRAS